MNKDRAHEACQSCLCIQWLDSGLAYRDATRQPRTGHIDSAGQKQQPFSYGRILLHTDNSVLDMFICESPNSVLACRPSERTVSQSRNARRPSHVDTHGKQHHDFASRKWPLRWSLVFPWGFVRDLRTLILLSSPQSVQVGLIARLQRPSP